MTPADLERLAEAVGDAFFAACGEPERWRTCREHQRATFRAMTRAALAAGQAYRAARGLSLPHAVARELAEAFLANPDCPRWLKVRYDWRAGTLRDQARPIWLAVAHALIEAGAALKLERRPRPAERARPANTNFEPEEEAAHG